MSAFKDRLKEARAPLQGPAAPRSEDRCSFCRRARAQTTHLLAGFGAFICESCVRHAAETVIVGLERGSGEPTLTSGADRAQEEKELLKERVEHARGMQAVVDESVDAASVSLRRLVENLLAYLDTSSSDKWILTLPWKRLHELRAALTRLAAALDEGEQEANRASRK